MIVRQKKVQFQPISIEFSDEEYEFFKKYGIKQQFVITNRNSFDSFVEKMKQIQWNASAIKESNAAACVLKYLVVHAIVDVPKKDKPTNFVVYIIDWID
ncbi:MAG: hypothetical protein D6732_03335 [Methanobacteriota archaeon]|nr:MAG: hypothetical protein D6732_03335 [Euryarchaeota archaeon]